MNVRIMELSKEGYPYAKVDEQGAWYAEIDTSDGIRFAIQEKAGGIIVTAKEGCIAIYPHGDNQVSIMARGDNG